MSDDKLPENAALPERRITVRDIQKVVAGYYKISMKEFLKPGREQPRMTWRQTAMYLATRLTTVSMPQIAGRFGLSEPSSVRHAKEVIADRRQKDPALDAEIVELERLIRLPNPPAAPAATP